MYASVYCTRSKGVRLPTPRRPQTGRLVLEDRSDGYTKQLAAKLLLGEKGDTMVLPELRDAKVLKITASGIVIAGYEVVPRRSNNKASADYWRQTWWCLIHTVQVAEAFDVYGPDHPFGFG